MFHWCCATCVHAAWAETEGATIAGRAFTGTLQHVPLMMSYKQASLLCPPLIAPTELCTIPARARSCGCRHVSAWVPTASAETTTAKPDQAQHASNQHPPQQHDQATQQQCSSSSSQACICSITCVISNIHTAAGRGWTAWQASLAQYCHVCALLTQSAPPWPCWYQPTTPAQHCKLPYPAAGRAAPTTACSCRWQPL